MRGLFVVPAAIVVVAACAAGSSGPAVTSSTTPSVEPTVASASPSSPGTTLVKSISNSCSFTLTGDTTVGKSEVLVEHFTCRYVMTDDRVSGTFEAEIKTTFDPADAPTARWEGTMSLQSAGGSWEGTGRGAVVMWDDVRGPTNYGIDTYKGQGAYAGLTYTELIAGGDYGVNISGWISPEH